MNNCVSYLNEKDKAQNLILIFVYCDVLLSGKTKLYTSGLYNALDLDNDSEICFGAYAACKKLHL